jgi:hypothetical protein
MQTEMHACALLFLDRFSNVADAIVCICTCTQLPMRPPREPVFKDTRYVRCICRCVRGVVCACVWPLSIYFSLMLCM